MKRFTGNNNLELTGLKRVIRMPNSFTLKLLQEKRKHKIWGINDENRNWRDRDATLAGLKSKNLRGDE